MGFLSRLFGQKQNDKSKLHADIKKHPVTGAKLPNLEFYERVVDHIVVSDTLRDDLKVELRQAFEDPKSFYDHHNEFILADH